MNTKSYFLGLLMIILCTTSVNAQKKIGVFIHGFNGSGEKWTVASKAPKNFKNNGVINESVVFNYSTLELQNATTQAAMVQRFVSQMDAVGSRNSDKWILIGHSLGGIVARELYPVFRSYGFNVEAVVSIGGPSQGAAATDVDTVVISNEFNRLKTDFEKATSNEWPALSFYLNVGNIFNFIFFQIPTLGNGTPSARTALNQIPEMIVFARDSALGYANYVIKSDAKELIGLNGSIINSINGYSKNNIYQHPQNYLAVIGAEKDPTPFRMAGHIFSSDESNDEVENVSQIEEFDNDYMRPNQRHWNRLADRYAICAVWSGDCRRSRDTARRKEGYWITARTDIQNLGTVWGKLINSYRLVQQPYQVFIPPCEEDGEFPGPQLLIIADPLDCSSNPGGEWITEYTTVQVADKNDGVVNTHSVLWSSTDSFDDLHNLYFDDLPVDGGYNHFELRHYFRPYTLPGVFNKGDINPPMRDVENWIKDDYSF